MQSGVARRDRPRSGLGKPYSLYEAGILMKVRTTGGEFSWYWYCTNASRQQRGTRKRRLRRSQFYFVLERCDVFAVE